jgi:site-specific DNA recombinase
MKAALYLRVSTQDQIENYSIESQRERLEAYCKAKGWSIYDTFIDGGYTGSNTDRPALQQMLGELKHIDAVVVYRLDRLSRSQRDTLTLIEDYFLPNNVAFVSLSEALDTSTPFGKAMIGILSVFAQLERETIAERMRMGHIKRAEEGLRGMGGDYDPAGYTRHDGSLVVNVEEATHIQLTYDLYEQYHSITKVQKQLKDLGYSVWRFRRYRDILSNKLYCGYVSFAGESYTGQHQGIISEDQFERVQILMSRHKGHNAHKAKQSLFSSLIICGCCGENYTAYNSKNKKTKDLYRYYICRARRFPSEYAKKCMNKTWTQGSLEDLVSHELKNLSINKLAIDKTDKQVNYPQLLKKIDGKIERILALYADGSIDKVILNKQIAKMDDEKRSIIQSKKKQDDQINTTLTQSKLEQYVIGLSNVEFNEKQAIVQKLIHCIVINGDSIEIEWLF